MSEHRQNPDQLLQRTKDEERKSSRGKLKIYLGAAPGVGKTYTMLHDALQIREKGLDVVIGIAESHGRSEIDKTIKKFEVLPRQVINYHGKTCLELDLDAALKRNPGLILIDEMAHSNPEGLRHTKRWQDINEFLDRGIDVYTTLNVQHIESLKDDVAQIIRAPVSETVPDSMLEMANTIEVVDLPPEELLKRLQEGKIYISEQANLATEHFFRMGNLIALRELALRTVAERVGTDVLLYRQNEGIKQIWPTRDKILVCVGPRLESHKLIRAAKRIATNLSAEWIAVYVDVPKLGVTSEHRNAAIQNLRLAEQLGAVTHVLNGFDIVKEIIEFAREQNITQIMIRKTTNSLFGNLFRRNLSDEILRNCGEIDVYVMTRDPSKSKTNKHYHKKKTSWKYYSLATLILLGATLINGLLFPYFVTTDLAMIYLLSLVIIARFGLLSVSTFASILSVLIYDFFFIHPFLSFYVADFKSLFTPLMMFFVVQIISYVTILNRRHEESSRIVQYQTTALYTLSRKLTKTRGVEQLVSEGVKFISETFNCEVMALLLKKNHLEIQASFPLKEKLDLKEKSVARWVYDMGKPAGLGTDTLSFSHALYLPLKAAYGTIAVLRIEPKNRQLFSPEQQNLLESCVNQLSLALEVDRLQEKTTKKELKIKTERARITVLEAISNDLSNPITKIISSADTLKAEDNDGIKTIGKDIAYEITKLSQLNNNIVRIIQLEFEDFKLEKKMVSIKVMINYVFKKLHLILKERPVTIEIPNNLPKISLNKVLIQEVLRNLIDNAVKFTPHNSPIIIIVTLKKEMIVVSVEDLGPGISVEEKDRLFEKFYRGKQLLSIRGLGLGLAVCHKIISAHGGKIWVENIEGKGAAFRFTLPLL